jgi:hypothetical protein
MSKKLLNDLKVFFRITTTVFIINTRQWVMKRTYR